MTDGKTKSKLTIMIVNLIKYNINQSIRMVIRDLQHKSDLICYNNLNLKGYITKILSS